MSISAKYLKASLALVLAFLPASACFAQATRTWVSGVGDDANPCSRTAPCKTFAGAISKTAAKGIIDVLDPGGFGAVTITKSITIEAIGTVAGVLVSGTNGIVVNAGSGDQVVLRGLSIDGVGTGINGINFLAGNKLVVENTTIQNFTQNGISFTPPGPAVLVVNNSTINGNTNAGVLVQPGAVGPVAASLGSVKLLHNAFGALDVGATLAVDHSVISGNNVGLSAQGFAAPTRINANDSLISDSAAIGVKALGGQAAVHLSNVSVTNNGTGLQAGGSGQIVSFGTNRVFLNTTNGAPSSTVPQQ